jgi:hypothetical protein
MQSITDEQIGDGLTALFTAFVAPSKMSSEHVGCLERRGGFVVPENRGRTKEVLDVCPRFLEPGIP